MPPNGAKRADRPLSASVDSAIARSASASARSAEQGGSYFSRLMRGALDYVDEQGSGHGKKKNGRPHSSLGLSSERLGKATNTWTQNVQNSNRPLSGNSSISRPLREYVKPEDQPLTAVVDADGVPEHLQGYGRNIWEHRHIDPAKGQGTNAKAVRLAHQKAEEGEAGGVMQRLARPASAPMQQLKEQLGLSGSNYRFHLKNVEVQKPEPRHFDIVVDATSSWDINSADLDTHELTKNTRHHRLYYTWSLQRKEPSVGTRFTQTTWEQLRNSGDVAIEDVIQWCSDVRPRCIHDYKPLLVLLQNVLRVLLEKELDFFSTAMSDLKNKLKEAGLQIDDLEEENKRLQRELSLSNVGDTVGKAGRTLMLRAQKRKTEARLAAELSQAERQAMEEKRRQMQQQQDAMDEILRKAREEVDFFKKQNAELKERNEELEERNKHLLKKLEEANEKNRKLQAQADQDKADIEAMMKVLRQEGPLESLKLLFDEKGAWQFVSDMDEMRVITKIALEHIELKYGGFCELTRVAYNEKMDPDGDDDPDSYDDNVLEIIVSSFKNAVEGKMAGAHVPQSAPHLFAAANSREIVKVVNKWMKRPNTEDDAGTPLAWAPPPEGREGGEGEAGEGGALSPTLGGQTVQSVRESEPLSLDDQLKRGAPEQPVSPEAHETPAKPLRVEGGGLSFQHHVDLAQMNIDETGGVDAVDEEDIVFTAPVIVAPPSEQTRLAEVWGVLEARTKRDNDLAGKEGEDLQSAITLMAEGMSRIAQRFRQMELQGLLKASKKQAGMRWALLRESHTGKKRGFWSLSSALKERREKMAELRLQQKRLHELEQQRHSIDKMLSKEGAKNAMAQIKGYRTPTFNIISVMVALYTTLGHDSIWELCPLDKNGIYMVPVDGYEEIWKVMHKRINTTMLLKQMKTFKPECNITNGPYTVYDEGPEGKVNRTAKRNETVDLVLSLVSIDQAQRASLAVGLCHQWTNVMALLTRTLEKIGNLERDLGFEEVDEVNMDKDPPWLAEQKKEADNLRQKASKSIFGDAQ